MNSGYLLGPVLATALLSTPQELSDPLTSLEVETGWQRIFDGRHPEGWRSFAGDSFPKEGWTTSDGALVHAAGGGGGDIVTNATYGDFELEFEWRAVDGANSGVKYRVAQSRQPAMLGPEYQVLDDLEAREAGDTLHAAGALYDLVAPAGKQLAPAGDFNTARIVARGSHIEHWLNGTRILSVDLDSEEWLEALTRSKFAGDPAFATGAGHIGLQDHGGEVWFRNLRLRDWDRSPGRDVELFKNDDLDAWRSIGDAVYRPFEGSILGEVGGGGQSFLITKRTFGDFVFEVDVKPELPGNSGIQVRSHIRNPGTRKQRLYGYQIEIDSSERAWSGGLYDEARRGWLDNLEDNEAGRAAFATNDWNRYRIECLGPSIRAWVNGIPTADYMDCMDMEGVIGLQVHSGNNTRVLWRNLRLRDLGTRAWNDISHVPASGVAVLLSDSKVEVWGDFAIRMRFEGSSPFRLGLRVRRGARLGGEGERLVPGLYLHEGKNPGWSIDPFDPALLPLHKDGWNELSLACYGRRAALQINDRQAFDFRELEGALEGMLVLWPEGEEGLAIERLQALGEPE
jgi:hypothetical protein